jgi:uroporphyrinogen-III synthase
MVQPMLSIAFEPAPSDVATPRALLVTSQNAVKALVRWPRAVGWREVPLFAAGPATAEACRAAGFRDVHAADGGVAALAELAATTLPRGDGTLLYPAARDRTGDLDGILGELGYDVATVVAYRAEAVRRLDGKVRAALAGQTIDGVLLYSRRTAENFRHLVVGAGLEPMLSRMAYYVISQEVAEELPVDAPVNVAAEPTEASLLALIPAG